MSRASQRRRSSSDDEGGGANWMDTYGDLVTLLLTFFVFLFAFSSVDASKWEAVAASFSGRVIFAIPTMDVSTVTSPAITPLAATTEDSTDDSGMKGMAEFYSLYDNLNEYIEENNLEAELLASPETRTLIMRFAANVLFTSGSASITPEFYPTMDHVVSLFAENERLISMVQIQGHTDNIPIHTAQFTDNWDLSITRAANVLRYLLDSGQIDKTKVSAVGYGEFHPVVENDSAENRAKNRRVDFVIESAMIDYDQPLQ